MTRPTSELAHLFRALKAPAAARALPKLAERARSEEWSFEQFAGALLKTEADSRDSHGGQGRIKAARFPARKTFQGMDVSVRRGAATDARAAADLWLRARTAALGVIPSPVHSDDEVRAWFASHVVRETELWMA